MNCNEIWCSICCRYMDEGCRKCSHFDEQVHLSDIDKEYGMLTNGKRMTAKDLELEYWKELKIKAEREIERLIKELRKEGEE